MCRGRSSSSPRRSSSAAQRERPLRCPPPNLLSHVRRCAAVRCRLCAVPHQRISTAWDSADSQRSTEASSGRRPPSLVQPLHTTLCCLAALCSPAGCAVAVRSPTVLQLLSTVSLFLPTCGAGCMRVLRILPSCMYPAMRLSSTPCCYTCRRPASAACCTRLATPRTQTMRLCWSASWQRDTRTLSSWASPPTRTTTRTSSSLRSYTHHHLTPSQSAHSNGGS